jgi:hypothetical protein
VRALPSVAGMAASRRGCSLRTQSGALVTGHRFSAPRIGLRRCGRISGELPFRASGVSRLVGCGPWDQCDATSLVTASITASRRLARSGAVVVLNSGFSVAQALAIDWTSTRIAVASDRSVSLPSL